MNRTFGKPSHPCARIGWNYLNYASINTWLEVLVKLFTSLVTKKFISLSSENSLNLFKALSPLSNCKVSLLRIVTEITWNVWTDRLQDVGAWYRVRVANKPLSQKCLFFLVCNVTEELLKFSGSNLGGKRTETIFLAQKGLRRTKVRQSVNTIAVSSSMTWPNDTILKRVCSYHKIGTSWKFLACLQFF